MDQQIEEDKRYGLFYTLTFLLSVLSVCIFANEHFTLLLLLFVFSGFIGTLEICIIYNLAVSFGEDFSY